MADILIRGMEMPETCGLCKLCLDDSRICNGYCMFFHRRVNMMERDKNCPLVPLPEGHGRMGDLDALMPDFVKARWEFFSDGDTFLRLLKNAPTIVPAEGGKADGN